MRVTVVGVLIVVVGLVLFVAVLDRVNRNLSEAKNNQSGNKKADDNDQPKNSDN